MTRVALLAAPALALVVAAGNPSPGGYGPAGSVFRDGRTVGVRLQNSSVVLKGDVHGKPGGYRIKRPCWYEPDKNAEDMLKAQEALRPYWFHFTPGATEERFQKFLDQFRDKVGQDGRWWSPAYNADDPDGLSCWLGLRFLIWVPGRGTPPGGITREELLQIARAALTVPEPKIKLSPAGKSYVNLPTFVALSPTGRTTRSVTAELPGVMSATVTAKLAEIRVDAGTTGDRAEVRQRCGTSGQAYVQGAAFTCGVRYLRASDDQPGGAYTLTVTTVWPVTIDAGRAVAPSGFEPVRASVTRRVPVGEVQSTVRRAG